MITLKRDNWQVATVIMFGLALWGLSSVAKDTASACEVQAIEDVAAAKHTENLLSACRMVLDEAHILANEAVDLIKISDGNIDKLFERCVPVEPRPIISHGRHGLK